MFLPNKLPQNVLPQSVLPPNKPLPHKPPVVVQGMYLLLV
jgi:hypothetical protein